MRTKETLAAAAAFAVLAAVLYLLWPAGAAPPASSAPRESTPPAAAPVAAAFDAGAAPEGAVDDATRRDAVPAPATPGRGDLVVRLLHGDDRSPAADVMVTAFKKNEVPRNASAPSVDAKRRRTDAEGIARFPDMRAGRTGLIADRGHWYENAFVVAGKATEVEFVMPVGVTVTGVVVGAGGAPVPGAQVELESSVVALADGQGRFTVRGASEHYSIGARAVGHGASKAQKLLAHDGRAEVRLELGAAGGIVEGVALDPDGAPLADVRVTIGRYASGTSWVGDDPPRPARPRTDADGRFRAIGILPGAQRISARAPGLVPWTGSCEVVADTTATVTIAFARGNTLRGTLHDADGRPFGDVLIGARAGDLDWDEVIHADGTFEIAGLPDGAIELEVDAEGAGEARARVAMLPGGAVTTCELTLVRGRVVNGRVRDEAGHPLPRVNVRWRPPTKGMGYTFTDQDGAFTIANAPAGRFGISIDGDEIVDARFDDLDPRGGELELRAQRRAAKTVYIAGVVLDPDGRPAVARAWAAGGGSSDIVEQATDAAGFFEIGPVPPGSWHLSIETRSFPRVSFERRVLEANSRWDVGTVRLAAGGDVRVEVVEGAADAVRFSILGDGQRRFRIDGGSGGSGASEQLPVGSYRLLVSGSGLAAQSIPFAIRAGATTQLEVRARAGVRQQFDLALPERAEPRFGSLRILRGGDLVATAWARHEPGTPCTAAACLEPGDYSVVAEFGELRGAAPFIVGGRESGPVRVVVRRE